MKLINKLVILIFSFSFFSFSGQPVLAKNDNVNEQIISNVSKLSHEELRTAADELSINAEELENLEENLEKALKKTGEVKINEVKKVQISENLFLEATLEEIPSETDSLLEYNSNSGIDNILNNTRATRSTTRRTLRATYRMSNNLNKNVGNLYAHGVFRTNGSVSQPVDAYGTYSAPMWSINSSGKKGYSTYNSYVRVSFNCKLKIGIDPVNITLQSFKTAATINCNAKGKATASWR